MGRNPFDKSQKPQPESSEQIDLPPGWNVSKDKTDPTGSASPPARTHIEGIPTADWQPKPRQKDTRKRTKARKLSLFQKNKQALTKYASNLKVPEHELVRYLLEYGLEQVDSKIAGSPARCPERRRQARASRGGR